ncbi:phosphopantothenoylcysteine decarboxylase subunit VHS3-like [Quercus robur]|uniref:phosphopantothenoylcysteine decarboxylase subunit VHS3-like n=1 Tax=Quercus robur TaxID=38942 RepID=UPI002162A560|nr:phosphopantothenoylcysteine decarboxylase subunit VHS3-like [Quercus robur]
MPEIDIILYHGGPLKNVNANKGLPFEGPGIKTYYTQIDRRLKTLDELKKIIMEELCENPAIHNIQITYRMPNEILKHRINYKYMVIETDKHVKIMFDKLERIGEVTNIELYIQLEPRAVWEEDIQQTTTSLQVMVPDAQYEYSTHVEDDYVHADGDVHVDGDDDDDDDDDDYVDETTAINNDDDDDDDDYVDENIAINGEDFVDRDEQCH